MAGLIRRQTLTERQYLRANRVMCLILLVSYITYIIVEIMNAKMEMNPEAMTRCCIYGTAGLLSLIACITMPRKKRTAVAMAIFYLIAFATLIFGNGIVVLAMVFPVLVGFMIYLNSVIVGLGCTGAIIIGIIKCISVKHDSVLFNYGILILTGYIVATIGAMSVVILLINFSKEDRAVIEEAVEQRKKVADTVAQIVANLYKDFTHMLHGLNTINNAMSSADDAMNGIAVSSTDTANAVNNQAKMTTHIQSNLEQTDHLMSDANNITETLKTVIQDGGTLSDTLLEQSNVVDHNVEMISDVMTRLLNNVQKVTGITNSILSISSQTNLLALNASVEAARAGAAGRGFAVIAGQIRTMSSETEESTEKIESIIKELTALTNETQTVIQQAAVNISEQRRQVHAVNDSFHQVQKGMLTLQKSIEIMGSNVKSVLDANSEIVDSISLLSAASEEMSASIQVCKQTTDTAFENLENFSKKVNGTFNQLQRLKETAASDESDIRK